MPKNMKAEEETKRMNKMEEKKSDKDRDRQRDRAIAPVPSAAGGLQTQSAWFSNLALSLMSLFIQLQYQTFPFPA